MLYLFSISHFDRAFLIFPANSNNNYSAEEGGRPGPKSGSYGGKMAVVRVNKMAASSRFWHLSRGRGHPNPIQCLEKSQVSPKVSYPEVQYRIINWGVTETG